ncbi:MAG: hypothetical protein QJR01_00685 [Kyrpidia sp.]|nr:hypothetical protein [Kyrpidia sp.]
MTEREFLSMFDQDVLALGEEADGIKRERFGDRVFLVERYVSRPGLGGNEADGPAERVPGLLDGGEPPRSIVLDPHLEDAESLAGRISTLRSTGYRGSLSGPSAGHVWRWAGASRSKAEELLRRFKEAGMSLLRGDDAEVLDERWRSGRSLLPLEVWLGVHRLAHEVGLPSSVALRYGAGETRQTRVRELMALAEWARDGQLVSLRLEPWDPERWPLSDRLDLAPTTGLDDLTMVSASRIALPDAHLEVSWRMVDEKLAQTALRFGADSLSGTPWRRWDEPFPLTGIEAGDARQLERLVRETGLVPEWVSEQFQMVRDRGRPD